MLAFRSIANWHSSAALEHWRSQSTAKEAAILDTISRLQWTLSEWKQTHGGREPTEEETRLLLRIEYPLRFDAVGDAHYTDPKTGAVARLWFRDRTFWTGVLMPDASLFEVPRPKPSPAAATYRAVRQLLVAFGFVLWIFLVSLYLLRGSGGAARTDLASLAVLTIAVACGITFLLLLPQRYWTHWYPTVHAMPVVGIGLIVVSVGLWFQTKLEPRKLDFTPRCRGCGYNLTGNRSGVCPECGRPTGRR
jgi:hypothetical protein